ncbi:MAG: hypothetical protein HKN22_03625, partial [Bacteroidia bacterium]|nr:hypothetical protein [Bacteroidia bacterium]
MIRYSKELVLPGFDNTSLFNIIKFFTKGLLLGRIQTRAKSLAFSFFLALFPFIIFIFTLIAYIPVPGFQDELLAMIFQLLPSGTVESVDQTIADIITRQRGGLLSFGFLFALYFSTNGVYA